LPHAHHAAPVNPTPSESDPGPVTVLLQQAADAQIPAEELVERLMPVVYEELREIARAQRRRIDVHSFQTTALVHEAYLRMVGRALIPERAYVFAAAAQAMRNVLVDHARRRSTRKRGGGQADLDFDDLQEVISDDELDGQAVRVLDVDAALTKLAALSPRAAQIAECRFFGGLSAEEAATALGLSRSTATREWRHARAWLHRYLGEDDADAAGLAEEGEPPPPPDAH
jgi:RNA polymerase sigma factor (TIGR02999 family)